MTVGADGRDLSRWLEAAASGADLSDAGYVALLGADGAELEELCALADELRAARVGDDITFVVNRNLDPARVWADRELLAELLDEASALGATEVCMQGRLPAAAGAAAYLELIAAVAESQPALHLHAFRPPEVADGAARLGLSPTAFLARARELGLGSVPGTAARILDDDIRAALSDNGDIPAADWIALIEAAHGVGLRSTATMVYGHLESPAQQVAHLRTLAAIQDRSGGFSELILMPIQPDQVPPAIAGAVRYAGARETRALHAVARLLLAGRIDHIQAAWPKLGLDLAAQLLTGGADDIGGILLDGSRAPDAGPEAGTTLEPAALAALAAQLGRRLRQRTTLYGEPGVR